MNSKRRQNLYYVSCESMAMSFQTENWRFFFDGCFHIYDDKTLTKTAAIITVTIYVHFYEKKVHIK